MGFSRRAKRGIGIFNHLKQKSPKRWRYSAKKMTIEPLKLADNITEAAIKAMDALPEEMRNAYIPELSVQKEDAEPKKQEIGTEQSISIQSQDSAETEKGAPGGLSCGN